jgi:hypothetical protein
MPSWPPFSAAVLNSTVRVSTLSQRTPWPAACTIIVEASSIQTQHLSACVLLMATSRQCYLYWACAGHVCGRE